MRPTLAALCLIFAMHTAGWLYGGPNYGQFHLWPAVAVGLLCSSAAWLLYKE